MVLASSSAQHGPRSGATGVILDVFQQEQEERTPLTLNERVAELLAALQAGEFTDRIRSSLEWTLLKLIEAETTAQVGAAPWELRGPAGSAQWASAEAVVTPAGDVELAIPKLKRGSFFPSLVERRPRIDRALCGGHGGLRPWGLDEKGGPAYVGLRRDRKAHHITPWRSRRRSVAAR